MYFGWCSKFPVEFEPETFPFQYNTLTLWDPFTSNCYFELNIVFALLRMYSFIAVSRAILKPVYLFGIPNSDPQTLESVKINLSKNRQLTVQALVP